MESTNLLRVKEQEMIAEIKGRTDRVLEFDIAGVFFSAVFAGVFMVTRIRVILMVAYYVVIRCLDSLLSIH